MATWRRVPAAMNRFTSAWQQVVKRTIAHWRLLSSVTIGVVLASTVMSGTVLYFDALRQLALKQAMAEHTPVELDIVTEKNKGKTYKKISYKGPIDGISKLADIVKEVLKK